jgi:hypothetical protein
LGSHTDGKTAPSKAISIEQNSAKRGNIDKQRQTRQYRERRRRPLKGFCKSDLSFARIWCASPLILFIIYIIGNAAVPTWGDALHGGSNEENRDGICSRNRHRGHNATKQPKPLPAPNSDFYEIYETLNAEELATVKRVRAFMEAKVDLNLNLADGTYFLRARLNVRLPGVDREMAQAIVNEAHQICPYSQATRGNIDVAINLI